MKKLWQKIGRFVVTVGIISIYKKLAGFICSMVKKQENCVKDADQSQNLPKTDQNLKSNADLPKNEPVEDKKTNQVEQNATKHTETAQISIIPQITNNTLKVPVLPENKENQFIKALKLVVVNKYDPIIIYCHAYHETNNFKSLIGDFNYFGLKCPSLIPPSPEIGWKGKSILKTTHETTNGVSKKINDWFCDFETADDCLIFYMYQIKRLYYNSYENRKNATLFFYWLTRDKNRFATDLTYTDKLIKLYADLKVNGIEQKLLDISKNI